MSIFTAFLKNRNFISKIRRSKVTDFAALYKHMLSDWVWHASTKLTLTNRLVDHVVKHLIAWCSKSTKPCVVQVVEGIMIEAWWFWVSFITSVDIGETKSWIRFCWEPIRSQSYKLSIMYSGVSCKRRNTQGHDNNITMINGPCEDSGQLGLGNHFYHNRWAPLSVTISLKYMGIFRIGRYPNVKVLVITAKTARYQIGPQISSYANLSNRYTCKINW